MHGPKPARNTPSGDCFTKLQFLPERCAAAGAQQEIIYPSAGTYECRRVEFTDCCANYVLRHMHMARSVQLCEVPAGSNRSC